MLSAPGMLTPATLGENVGEMRCSFLEMKLQLSTAAAQSTGIYWPLLFPRSEIPLVLGKEEPGGCSYLVSYCYSYLIFLSLEWGWGEQDRVYLHCISSTLEISEQQTDGEV